MILDAWQCHSFQVEIKECFGILFSANLIPLINGLDGINLFTFQIRQIPIKHVGLTGQNITRLGQFIISKEISRILSNLRRVNAHVIYPFNNFFCWSYQISNLYQIDRVYKKLSLLYVVRSGFYIFIEQFIEVSDAFM